jgi:hypothetical protein
MAGKIMTLSWRKGSWLENHDAFLEETIMAGKIMTLSWRKGSWLENHDAFLEETIMAGKIMTLSWRKGSWLENHDAFLEERIMAGKPKESAAWAPSLVPNETLGSGSGAEILCKITNSCICKPLCVLNLSQRRNLLC